MRWIISFGAKNVQGTAFTPIQQIDGCITTYPTKSTLVPPQSAFASGRYVSPGFIVIQKTASVGVDCIAIGIVIVEYASWVYILVATS